jgi:AcrR family transcriptional regulator
MSETAEQVQNGDTKAALLVAARSLLAQDGGKFTVRAVCAEAGLDRAEFNNHFANKDELMAALGTPAETPAPAPDAAAPPAGDAWLERRLRVFERALTALEARAESNARDQSRAIALLEERLAAQSLAPVAVNFTKPVIEIPRAVPAERIARIAHPEPVEPAVETPEPEAEPAEWTAPEMEEPELPFAAPPFQQDDGPDIDVASQTGQDSPEETPPDYYSREEMTDVLANARRAARNATPVEIPSDNATSRLRWIAAGILCLVAVFASVGLVLGGGARATQAIESGAGLVHRQLAGTPVTQLIARADSGEAKAQAQLAFAYLRGDGVEKNALSALRWASQAAGRGEPVAQYLLGTLYQKGPQRPGITADPPRAFQLFTAAAEKGNIKAMHNLAIAYAEGLGTQKDEAKAAHWFQRAAERGYVDSAFDLAVLYERGLGVKQSLTDALRWYSIAAMAGDKPSADRAAFLRHQVPAKDAVLAANAAASFAPLAPISTANSL